MSERLARIGGDDHEYRREETEAKDVDCGQRSDRDDAADFRDDERHVLILPIMTPAFSVRISVEVRSVKEALAWEGYFTKEEEALVHNR